VEPTYGGEACILFAGRNASDTLLASQNITELKRSIVERFPKLDGADLDAAATQLASMQPSKASVVTCNIYHYGATAALVGDAAHATGGVSGQGVNSALMDASVLADCLMDQYDSGDTVASLRNALLAYSKKQVPEGKALYELSFGPKPTSFGKRLGVTASSALDFLFKGRFGIGRLPLQTLLTTSLQPFAEIRRDLGTRYDDDFPDEVEWGETITNLDAKATTSTSAAQSS
jgi:2-polyprenyl-6-methoxyphenol hydroxylase-like FAD-dependent oxidoreductase